MFAATVALGTLGLGGVGLSTSVAVSNRKMKKQKKQVIRYRNPKKLITIIISISIFSLTVTAGIITILLKAKGLL